MMKEILEKIIELPKTYLSSGNADAYVKVDDVLDIIKATAVPGKEKRTDLISRNAVLGMIHAFRNTKDGQLCDLSDGVRIMPGAECEKADWIFVGNGGGFMNIECWKEYECSICKRQVRLGERKDLLSEFPFCHCGAYMKGVRDEHNCLPKMW